MKTNNFSRLNFLVMGVLSLSVIAQVEAVIVEIKVENLTPTNGVFMTPMWLGFHEGGFDLFDPGVAITPGGGLERLAEDGDAGVLSNAFMSGPAGRFDSVITAPAGFPGAPVFDPGDMATASFNIDPIANRYLNYATMIIPSNDAFIGNPTPLELFDAGGNFKGKQIITILGINVWDAGTEANTETNAAFFDQVAGNMGITTLDPVMSHVGFINSVGNPGGTSIILGGTSTSPPGIFFDAVGADFTLNQAVVARITIVPEPVTLLFLGVGGIMLSVKRRKKLHN